MVTAQNVRDVRFTKTMGGYKTTEVDSFLDQCADTIEALNKDAEENTRKMQVLAETIVDYRNQEDSIRTALMSAQRMSETVIAEANEKASAIIAEAEGKAATIEDETKKRIQAELDEIARIQNEVVAFRSRLLATYREHLTLIGVLADEEKSEEQAPSAPIGTESTEPEEEDVAVVEEQPAAEVLIPDTAQEVKIDISAFELKDDE